MTPAEIAALSACFSCIGDRQAAILFLLARIADVTIEEIIAGSACFRCLSDFQAAELFLLNEIVTNGTGGGGGGGNGSVLLTNGDPEGVLVAPTAAAIAYDPANSATYEYTGVAGGNTGWIFKV